MKYSLLVAALAATLSGQAHAAVTYRLTEIDIDGFFGAAINNAGQIAGTQFTQTSFVDSQGITNRTFSYNPLIWQNGNTTYLQNSTQVYTTTTSSTITHSNGAIVQDINNHGEVVGYKWTPPMPSIIAPAYWNASGALTTLTNTGGDARAINDHSQVAIDATENLIYDANTSTATNIGHLSRDIKDINNGGVVLGENVFYENGIWQAFPLLPTDPEFSTRFEANAINDHGVIVGDHSRGHASFLFENNQFTELGNLCSPEENCTQLNRQQANDINSLKQIVGESTHKAFLWEDGEIFDLNALIDPSDDLFGLYDLDAWLAGESGYFLLGEAVSINDSGDILVRGSLSSDPDTGFVQSYYLASPVPIPAAAWLFGTALAGLAGFRLRRG